MTLVVDEDIPRALAAVFAETGFELLDIRDVGLRSAPDGAIFRFAIEHEALLLTGDLGMVNPFLHDLSSIRGVLVTRLPEQLTLLERCRVLRRTLETYSPEDFVGHITTFEVGRLRRRPIER